MGDRTHVTIQYPAWADVLLAAEVGEDDLSRFWGDDREISQKLEAEDASASSNLSWIFLDECNWAEHPQEDLLKALHIPYDKEWGAGASYSAGFGKCRLENGGMILLEAADDQQSGELERLIRLYKENGRDAAIEKLDEIAARRSVHEFGNIRFVPPTPEQIQRIIDLLCPDGVIEEIRKAA